VIAGRADDTFPATIRAVRRSMAMPRHSFSKLILVSPETLRRWECGERHPARAKELCDHLRESVSEAAADAVAESLGYGKAAILRPMVPPAHLPPAASRLTVVLAELAGMSARIDRDGDGHDFGAWVNDCVCAILSASSRTHSGAIRADRHLELARLYVERLGGGKGDADGRR